MYLYLSYSTTGHGAIPNVFTSKANYMKQDQP